jgi:glucose-1-phosphate thymidylyltransferase
VFDKPMVYYPLTVLMLAGIREVLVISTPHDLPLFERLLGDGVAVGHAHRLRRAAAARGHRAGAADRPSRSSAATRCALVLGDNLFFGTASPRCSGAPPPVTPAPRCSGTWCRTRRATA